MEFTTAFKPFSSIRSDNVQKSHHIHKNMQMLQSFGLGGQNSNSINDL